MQCCKDRLILLRFSTVLMATKSSSDNAIVVDKLTKSFKDVKVLTGVSFSVERGTIFALLGPNGAGKTTTIRIMSTLMNADSGKVLIDGHDISKEADKVRSVIGLTGQYAAVDEYLTGTENLEMMGRLYRLSVADSKNRAKELLTQFDLEEAANRPAKTYSGGMRRRLDLAASLIAAPPVLFLDEPTTGLDPRSRLMMWEVIKKLVAEGTTILLTTQYLEEADQLADKIAVLDQGKIIAQGSSDELKQQVGKERLELTIDEKSNFDKAKKAIDSASLVADPKRRTLSVAMENGVHNLRDILSKLEDQDIEVESLSLHKPTLDDVFLKLTGHGAAETKEGESE